MKLNTMPKELAAELLTYIAEKEEFTTVCEGMNETISPMQIKALLRELAAYIQKEVSVEIEKPFNAKKCSYLSNEAKKIISYLTPKEERTLLKAFGLTQDKQK